MKQRSKTTFRTLKAYEMEACWYVELPFDRPTRRGRISEEEWLLMVKSLITWTPTGSYEVNGLFGTIAIGSADWKSLLANLAIQTQRRLFWEPMQSPPLSEDAARRYGGMATKPECRRGRADGTEPKRDRQSKPLSLFSEP